MLILTSFLRVELPSLFFRDLVEQNSKGLGMLSFTVDLSFSLNQLVVSVVSVKLLYAESQEF